MIETIISSSLLIAVLLVLRALFSMKISRRLQYALWGLVLLRLLMPFGLLGSPVSVMNALGMGQSAMTPATAADAAVYSNTVPAVVTDTVDTGPAVSAGATEALPIVGSGAEEANPTAPDNVPERIAVMVWISGSAVLALWLIGANIRFRYQLIRTRAIFHAPDFRLLVYITPAVASPCLTGFFRPAVYLTPKAAADSDALQYVLAHELAHFRQGDHIWTVLRGLCLAAYWWNPLVWAAALLSRTDSEMACDEAVIRKIGVENRLLYGRALVDMITAKSPTPAVFSAAATMSSGSRVLRKRLNRIAKCPKTARTAVVALVLAVIVLTGCTFTGAKKENAEAETAAAPGSMGVSELAETLYDRRNPYIGDASADGALLKALDISGKLGSYTIELETSGTPYVLRVLFDDAVKDAGALDAAMINNAIILLALIDNASEIQWVYKYDDRAADGIGTFTGSLTAEDAAATLNVTDIKEFAVSADKVQALLNRLPQQSEVSYTVQTLSRGAVTASTGVLDDTGAEVAEAAVMDHLLKSTLWPGVDIATLDECYMIRAVYTDGTTSDYYAFSLDGNTVMQAGKDGMYSQLDSSLYKKLTVLAKGITPADRTKLDACVTEAILSNNKDTHNIGSVTCESHVTLKTVDDGKSATVYAMVLCISFNITADGLTQTTGSHMPVALTFDKNDRGEFAFREYWVPTDGSYYLSSIEEKFPADITAQDIDTQRYIMDQMRAVYDQAMTYGIVDTDAVLGRLFDVIASSPAASSNPADYIAAHPIEYRELMFYGDFTLKHVYAEFLKGGQTGLKGQLMLSAMTELLGAEAQEFKVKAVTPQDWFDSWKAYAVKTLEDTTMDDLKNTHPKTYMLLQMMGE